MARHGAAGGPGWSRLLPDPGLIDDGTVAITLAAVLFFIPTRNREEGATRTEFTSNTATTEMILPILASVAVATGTHPLVLMIPATLSASCAFMMPVATPPNAIVFGSDRITVSEMARTGILLNLIGVVVIATVVYTVGLAVFDIDPAVVPEWARSLGG